MIIPIQPVAMSGETTQGQTSLVTLPPLSLYVHIPWCIKKCPYCDFNSHEMKGDFPELAYLQALRSDLEHALPAVWGRKIYTIFLGGGTPSLLSAAGLDQLLSDIRSLLPVDSDAEITMEANPGTFEADKFQAFRHSGVNRLSIGIQSFHDAHLKKLGRIHHGDEARQAIDIAQRYFDNINLDLMYALPGQTREEATTDVQTAIATGVPHVSLYHLTLEPNTLFAKYPPKLPDEEEGGAMQETISKYMQQAGYQHYEVSAYARPGHQARHNLNYWQFGDYLGIGAGAHAKISSPDHVVREMRYKNPKTYLQAAIKKQAIQVSQVVSREDLSFEFMLNTLRLTAGFSPQLFAERTGLSLNSIEPVLRRAEQKGLLYRDHQRICATGLGMRFLNDLQQMFLI